MIKMAFSEDSMSCTQVFEWCHSFREGRPSVEGDKHPRRPLTSRNSEMIDIVHDLLKSDTRLMIRKMSEEVGI
jgi:hypothetical protein